MTLNDALDGVRKSRAFFHKHLAGLREDQWDWKPYPECKSLRETLAHLVIDDRAALDALLTGREPDYDALSEGLYSQERERLLCLVAASHEELLSAIEERCKDAPMDARICIWGSMMPLASGVAYLSSEDFYHAGQAAFIRQATDPAWDYYAGVYGTSG